MNSNGDKTSLRYLSVISTATISPSEALLILSFDIYISFSNPELIIKLKKLDDEFAGVITFDLYLDNEYVDAYEVDIPAY